MLALYCINDFWVYSIGVNPRAFPYESTVRFVRQSVSGSGGGNLEDPFRFIFGIEFDRSM